MTKTKTKVADSMTQASAFWKISVPVMRRAKAAGCGAFIGQRIHIAPLREWLKSHPAEVRAAKQAAAGKGELDALKVRKMQAQVAEIELRVAHQKGELIPAAAAKADWLTAA
ncbi:MAG: hypothetical protein NTW21_37565, partial [Verrucomicrobia bacterium]|nr:hypothetical protein [Verrucomicrobiota bacterium]